MTDTDFVPADPHRAPRLAPAWAAAIEFLDDGEWREATTIIDHMLEHSDIIPTTCRGVLREGDKAGLLDRSYTRARRQKDQRLQYRLAKTD